MAQIRVGKAWANVDEEDWERLSGFKWYRDGSGYANRFEAWRDEAGQARRRTGADAL